MVGAFFFRFVKNHTLKVWLSVLRVRLKIKTEKKVIKLCLFSHPVKTCPWARHSSKLCEQSVTGTEHVSSVHKNSAGGLYAVFENRRSFQYVSDAGQSKCRVERNQALEQARRPQSSESMFIPECNEDGTFAQVRIQSSAAFSFPFKSFTLHLSLSISLMCTPPLQITPKLSFFFTDRKVHPLFFIYTLMCFTSSVCLASAGPVPYSDRLLLVCYQWWQASEWLLCAQQDPSVFRY